MRRERKKAVNRFGGNALFALQNTPTVLATFGQRPNDLHDLLQIIDKADDLNAVAMAFIAFRHEKPTPLAR